MVTASLAGCVIPAPLDEQERQVDPAFDPKILATDPPNDGTTFVLGTVEQATTQPLSLKIQDRNLDQDLSVRVFVDGVVTFIVAAVLPRPAPEPDAPDGGAPLDERTRDLVVDWCGAVRTGEHTLRVLVSDNGFDPEGPPFDRVPEGALTDEVFVRVNVEEGACASP